MGKGGPEGEVGEQRLRFLAPDRQGLTGAESSAKSPEQTDRELRHRGLHREDYSTGPRPGGDGD